MRPKRATPCAEKLGQRAGQDVADDAQGGLVLVVLALQVKEHGEVGQNRIFGRPGSWLHAEKMILEWFSAQRIQARVDPGNVSVEPPAIEFIEIGQDSPGNLPESKDARRAVALQDTIAGARPDDLCQLSGCRAADRVHLKEPVLGVDEPQPERDVIVVLRPDRGDSQHVAVDLDLPERTRNLDRAG